MKTEIQKTKRWIKKHKKELIASGVSVVTLTAIVIGFKYHQNVKMAWTSLKKLIDKKPETVPTSKIISLSEVSSVKEVVENGIMNSNRVPHDVVSHIRNLPEGMKPSAEKVATAAEQGIKLLPSQTWVKSYSTGKLTA